MKQFNSTQSHETRGLILAVTSVLCFTMTALLLSHLHSAYGVDGWVASGYRALIGLLVIITMQSKTGKLQITHILKNRLLLARGLIGGATIPVYYICIIELGPGRAGMISGAYPLFAAVFALFLLKETLKRSYFVYIALELIGLYNLQASALTLLAAITVVAAQLALTESFRYINVAKGSTLQMLTPALTVFLSALIIGEHFSIFELMGGAIILFASYQIVASR